MNGVPPCPLLLPISYFITPGSWVSSSGLLLDSLSSSSFSTSAPSGFSAGNLPVVRTRKRLPSMGPQAGRLGSIGSCAVPKRVATR